MRAMWSSQATRNLILLIAGGAFVYANNQMIAVTLPLHILRLGGSAAEVGLIAGIASLAALAGRLIAGQAADRAGRRPIILIAGALLVTLSMMYVVAQSVMALFVLRVAHLAVFGAVTTAFFAFSTDQGPEESRGQVLALVGLSMPLSLAVFPALASQVGHDRFSPVTGLALLVALGSVALFYGTREQWVQSPPQPAAAARPPGSRWPTFRESLAATTFSDRRTGIVAILAATACGLTDGIAIDLLPLFASSLEIRGYGFFFTLYALCLVACQLLVVYAIRRGGTGKLAALGLLLMGAAFLLLAMATDLVALGRVAIVYAAGFAASQTALATLATEGIAAQARGRVLSYFYFIFDVGRGIGLLVAGWTISTLGFSATFAGAAGFCAIWALLLALTDYSARNRRANAHVGPSRSVL